MLQRSGVALVVALRLAWWKVMLASASCSLKKVELFNWFGVFERQLLSVFALHVLVQS